MYNGVDTERLFTLADFDSEILKTDTISIKNCNCKNMATKSDVLGLFIPNSILGYIFASYLSLEDISRFDIAISNKKRRPMLLECIGLESCIWMGSKETELSSSMIPWLCNRSIKICNLICNQVYFDIAVKIFSIGSSISWLSIEDGAMDDRFM